MSKKDSTPQALANKKYKSKVGNLNQYKFEFYKKDSDLLDRFISVDGKFKNDKLRNLLDLYERNKDGDFGMTKLNKIILDYIIIAIKKVNDNRKNGDTISSDDNNDEIVGIFHNTMNKFNIEIIDDECLLSDIFGVDGLHAIRDAEAGMY